jgi:hypothetical protein
MSLRAAKAFDSAGAWGERRAGRHQAGWHISGRRGIMVLLGRRLSGPGPPTSWPKSCAKSNSRRLTRCTPWHWLCGGQLASAPRRILGPPRRQRESEPVPACVFGKPPVQRLTAASSCVSFAAPLTSPTHWPEGHVALLFLSRSSAYLSLRPVQSMLFADPRQDVD